MNIFHSFRVKLWLHSLFSKNREGYGAKKQIGCVVMVVSMTGFGRCHMETERFSVTVEIKTVNHRFLEFNIRMPRQLFVIEDKMKKKIGEFTTRGRVDVFITIGGSGQFSSKVNVDWNLLDEYIASIKAIQEKYEINNPISLQDILIREDFISFDEEQKGNEELETLVLSAVETAVKQLKQMRTIEGKSLEIDMHNQLQELSKKVLSLRDYAPNVAQHYAERLHKRMEEMTKGQVDESRLINEVAIFADKADINEELTRLHSHIDQFQKLMKIEEPIGRKMDFLLQEMNREVNTIGSKANDSSIAREVVEMKSLLEKMKEQVQNIE